MVDNVKKILMQTAYVMTKTLAWVILMFVGYVMGQEIFMNVDVQTLLHFPAIVMETHMMLLGFAVEYVSMILIRTEVVT